MKYNTTSSKAFAMLAIAALVSFGSIAHAEDQQQGEQNGQQGTQSAEHPGFWARLFPPGAEDGAPQPVPMMRSDMNASAPMPTEAHGDRQKPAVMGTVASVSGTTLTLTGKDGSTYTVDTSNSVVMKGIGRGAAASTLSAIPAGDTVIVMGTVSGKNVIATRIIFSLGGAMMKGGPGIEAGGSGHMMPERPAMIGTVASVTGTTISLIGKDSKTYTVDASAATFTKGIGKDAAVMLVSDIKAGDTLAVFGTSTDTAITAGKVIDGTGDVQWGEGEGDTQKVGGVVTSVVGTTITIKAKDGTLYTVDATNAAFAKTGDTETATTIAGVLVGDAVVVDGTAIGSNVVATKVLDGVRPLKYMKAETRMAAPASDDSASAPEAAPIPEKHSFIQKVGALFGRLKFW